MTQQRFTGRRVLVTGTAQGIGRRIAERFIEEGAEVIGLDLLADTAEAPFRQIALDITDAAAVETACKAIESEWGGLDILVNAAGILRLGDSESLTPEERAGDFAQAMMDLGAILCSPKRPACGLCPVRSGCEACAQGLAEVLPYREEKAERPTRRGTAFVVLRRDGAVLLRERPLKGLLGGMLEVPSTPWTERGESRKTALAHAPLEAEWRALPGIVEHTFTHFHLELSAYFAEAALSLRLTEAAAPERCRWVAIRDLHAVALPSVMRKVLSHALEARPQARAGAAPPRARRRSA